MLSGPNQYLHYHRAGHGMVTSPSAKRGYTAYVLAKMSRLQGASGIHVGTMGYGKMEGEKDDRAIAYIIERDSYTGPVYHQEWYGMKPTTPIISGGMNALRLPGFFENLGHGNVINTAGGGSYGHIDSPAAGAKSLRQAYDCWKAKADPVLKVMIPPWPGFGPGRSPDGAIDWPHHSSIQGAS